MQQQGDSKSKTRPVAQADPAAPLLTIIPRWLIIVITVCALLLLVSFLVAGSFWPQLFQHNTAKFFVCTMLAFCFSIAMFVIYPQEIRIKKIPGINLAVEVVGPPALFLVALPLLWHFYPGPAGRYYRLQTQPAKFRIQTTEVKVLDSQCTCQTVSDPNASDPNSVTGIYVEFKGAENECKVQIGDPFRTFIAVLKRDAKSDFAELKSP